MTQQINMDYHKIKKVILYLIKVEQVEKEYGWRD